MLISGGTAATNEALINGLRGIDVAVTLIGKTTFGKSYGFSPQYNCSRIYYAVEYKNANDKGFSDYDAGFAPDCEVADDLQQTLGDPAESLLSTALYHSKTGTCKAANASRLATVGSPAPANAFGPPRMLLANVRLPGPTPPANFNAYRSRH